MTFIGGIAIASAVPIPQYILYIAAACAAFFFTVLFVDRRAIVLAALCVGFVRVAFAPISFNILFALAQPLELVRDAFVVNISRVLPEPENAYLAGLLVGARSAIPASLKDAFRKTGTSHLTALSGYNVTIIVQNLGVISRSLWLPLGGIVLFVLATGAASSLVRAAIMGVLVMLAKKYGHAYSAQNALGATVAVMLFFDPTLLFHDIGFQLSILATLGLIWLSPYCERPFRWVPKKYGIRESIAQTLSAQATTLPLVLFYFGTFSIFSPLVNVLVSVTIPITMFFGFLVGTLGFLSRALSFIPAWPAFLLLHYQLAVIQFFAQLHVF